MKQIYEMAKKGRKQSWPNQASWAPLNCISFPYTDPKIESRMKVLAFRISRRIISPNSLGSAVMLGLSSMLSLHVSSTLDQASGNLGLTGLELGQFFFFPLYHIGGSALGERAVEEFLQPFYLPLQVSQLFV